MRSVLAAVGRALAALAMFAFVWCRETLQFVRKCMPGYVPPDPVDVLDTYVEAAAPAPTPAAESRLQCIQRVADDLFRERQPKPEDLKQLGERTRNWLTAINGDMLIAVAKAKPSELRAHLAGDKVIRGLLAYDPAGVAEYKKALEAQAHPSQNRSTLARAAERSSRSQHFGPLC